MSLSLLEVHQLFQDHCGYVEMNIAKPLLGNSGIGYETSRQLAIRGARVYVAGRSAQRINEAITKMKKGSSNLNLDLHPLELDLQDLQTVKGASLSFIDKESRLDL